MVFQIYLLNQYSLCGIIYCYNKITEPNSPQFQIFQKVNKNEKWENKQKKATKISDKIFKPLRKTNNNVPKKFSHFPNNPKPKRPIFKIIININ